MTEEKHLNAWQIWEWAIRKAAHYPRGVTGSVLQVIACRADRKTLSTALSQKYIASLVYDTEIEQIQRWQVNKVSAAVRRLELDGLLTVERYAFHLFRYGVSVNRYALQIRSPATGDAPFGDETTTSHSESPLTEPGFTTSEWNAPGGGDHNSQQPKQPEPSASDQDRAPGSQEDVGGQPPTPPEVGEPEPEPGLVDLVDKAVAYGLVRSNQRRSAHLWECVPQRGPGGMLKFGRWDDRYRDIARNEQVLQYLKQEVRLQEDPEAFEAFLRDTAFGTWKSEKETLERYPENTFNVSDARHRARTLEKIRQLEERWGFGNLDEEGNPGRNGSPPASPP